MARSQAGARAVRVCRKGDPLTLDYRADRLNAEIDANGAIVKLSCG